MGLPRVALERPCYFYWTYYFKNMLSLLFHLGFCWLIWYQLKSTLILITTSAEMELPWVCLRKTMLFLFALVFVNSKKVLILSTWILLIDLIPNKEKTSMPITTSAQMGLPWVLPWKDHVIIIWTCFCYFKSYVIIIVWSWILLIDLIPIKKHYETNYHFCGNGIAMRLPSNDHVIFICTCFC